MNWLRISLSTLLIVAAIAAFWLIGVPATGKITLTNARATLHQMDGAEVVAIALMISNEGAADRIMFVSSPDAKLAMFHGVVDPAGAPVPAGAAPSLSLDGAHIMLMGVEGELRDGRLIPLTVTFANAGEVTTKATLAAGADTMERAGRRDSHSMDHSAVMMVPAVDAPGVSVSATPMGDGWRIMVETTGFTFTPAAMDREHVPGEGHGHLYIGGLKIMRMIKKEAFIGALPPGRHQVRVTLNTNNHLAYRTDTGQVSATTFIDVPD